MITYKDAGVNLEAADKAVQIVKRILDKHGVSPSNFGLFGGFYRISSDRYLVSTVDGVGTKLKVAFMAGVHNTVGKDLVFHCSNDILVHGAEPAFFMDYIALGKLDLDVFSEIMEGFASACQEIGCVLLGGETAEMPGFYKEGEYDLVGFMAGVVEEEYLIDGKSVKEGDLLIGLPSSGLHTNGYSLARKVIFEKLGLKVDSKLPYDDITVAEELLKVHRSYYPLLKEPVKRKWIKGMAHITGGGIPGNLSRILPEGLRAVIDKTSWPIPEIFQFLVREAGIDEEEAFRTFNMGIGMILISDKEELMDYLKKEGENFYVIGRIEKGEGVVIR